MTNGSVETSTLKTHSKLTDIKLHHTKMLLHLVSSSHTPPFVFIYRLALARSRKQRSKKRGMSLEECFPFWSRECWQEVIQCVWVQGVSPGEQQWPVFPQYHSPWDSGVTPTNNPKGIATSES
jgi:hypothetical protein